MKKRGGSAGTEIIGERQSQKFEVKMQRLRSSSSPSSYKHVKKIYCFRKCVAESKSSLVVG